ncbi:TPA: hypothetical protein PC598_000245 [Morganella morganii]|nr:hypothetical protein [Morganella morganii]
MSASDDTDNNTNNDINTNNDMADNTDDNRRLANNNRFLMIYSSLKHITTPR